MFESHARLDSKSKAEFGRPQKIHYTCALLRPDFTLLYLIEQTRFLGITILSTLRIPPVVLEMI